MTNFEKWLHEEFNKAILEFEQISADRLGKRKMNEYTQSHERFLTLKLVFSQYYVLSGKETNETT